MATVREIKRRIRSIKNISQITKAVEMVAASKMRRSQDQALQGQPYSEIMQRILKNLASRDGLTGLYNHRYFQEYLIFELYRSSRNKDTFSLLFLDLDYFKKYNDSNGHLEGDKLLQSFAGILKKSIRRSNVVARYGGEEFVLLLPATSKANARIVGEKIRRQVESYPFKGRETQPQGKVTISIGISSFPDDGTDRSSLIQCADGAMYRAKNSGRNKVCLWSSDEVPNVELDRGISIGPENIVRDANVGGKRS